MPWLFFLFFLSSCGTTVYQPEQRPPQITFCPKHKVARSTIDSMTKELEVQVPVKFSLSNEDCSSNDIQCETIPEDDFAVLELTLSQTQREFAKYAKDALTHSGLKTVVFMKNLSLKGNAVGGIALNDSLYINTHVNNCALLGFQEILHHEFFHIVDTQLLSNPQKKEQWSSLNSAGFQYFGYDKGLSFSPSLSHVAMGFVTQYSMAAYEEDRAEIFKSLMIGLHSRRVAEWRKEDAYLSRKIDALKSELEGKEPTFNNDFWNKCKNSD